MDLQGLRVVNSDARFPDLIKGQSVALKSTPSRCLGEVQSMHTDDYLLLVEVRASAGNSKYALAEMLTRYQSL